MCSPSLCPTLPLHTSQLWHPSMASPNTKHQPFPAFGLSSVLVLHACSMLSPSPLLLPQGQTSDSEWVPTNLWSLEGLWARSAGNESRTFFYQGTEEFSDAKEEFGNLCRTGQSPRFLLANQIFFKISGAFYFQWLRSWSQQSEKNSN